MRFFRWADGYWMHLDFLFFLKVTKTAAAAEFHLSKSVLLPFYYKNPIFPLSPTAFTKVWNKRRKMNLVLNKHNVMYVHTSKKGKLWDHGEKEQTLKKLYCIQQSILEHYCLAKFSDPYACANIILKNGIFLKGTRNFSLWKKVDTCALIISKPQGLLKLKPDLIESIIVLSNRTRIATLALSLRARYDQHEISMLCE